MPTESNSDLSTSDPASGRLTATAAGEGSVRLREPPHRPGDEVLRHEPEGGEVDGSRAAARVLAPYGATLALTVTLAIACFMLVMSAVFLVVHPHGFLLTLQKLGTIEQNQSAKTLLYVASFVVVVPLAVAVVPRVADRVQAGPNAAALPALAALLAGSFAAAILVVRFSARLPWGDGLGTLLVCTLIWWMLAGALLARAAGPRPWPALLALSARARTVTTLLAGVLVFTALLAVTKLGSLHIVPLVLGAAVTLGVLAAYDRVSLPRARRGAGTALEALVGVLLLLAIVNVVVFTDGHGIPNPYFSPGIIQFHQDFLLGPANQLLRGGGALLVNVPSSQYGVGSIYFLYGWFHTVPIGYGTYGLLDGLLTALFYIAAYSVLRMARVGRVLAACAVAVGVVGLIYSLQYNVGALPQQGPLRFGLPMVVIVASVYGARVRRHERLARVIAMAAVGLSSIWALEAFGYTLFTFAAVTALEVCLRTPRNRVRWLLTVTAQTVGCCLAAHAILALATLAATGHLPHWGQYLAYVDAFLLGGAAGQEVYGFQPWSPGLIAGATAAASATAIVLLVRRAPAVVRNERAALVALTGLTAFAIALFSYTDNRSSTYLLAYLALPTLTLAGLWLSLLLRAGPAVPRWARLGTLAFGLAAAVLLISAAWPRVSTRFSESALAHTYPGGGLSAALHRLAHPPPIDPRAPEGERLVRDYLPGKRVIVILPDAPDLGTEILVRGGRANGLFVGDPKADSFVPSAWMETVGRQIARLHPGQRLLVDRAALPTLDGRAKPVQTSGATGAGASPYVEGNWIAQEIGRRFRLRPIYSDREGFIVEELRPRA